MSEEITFGSTNVCILSFSGESGAGKTESTKLMLKFLSVISQQSLELSLKEKTSCVEQAILESRYFFMSFVSNSGPSLSSGCGLLKKEFKSVGCFLFLDFFYNSSRKSLDMDLAVSDSLPHRARFALVRDPTERSAATSDQRATDSLWRPPGRQEFHPPASV